MKFEENYNKLLCLKTIQIESMFNNMFSKLKLKNNLVFKYGYKNLKQANFLYRHIRHF